MNYKKTGAEKSTITRDLVNLGDKTGNIFNSLSVVAKRSTENKKSVKIFSSEKLRRIIRQLLFAVEKSIIKLI